MLNKKLSREDLKMILLAMLPLIIMFIILLTQYLREINRSSELQLQVDMIHSEPLFPLSTIKAKMLHVETNIALLDKLLLSTKTDDTTIYVWNYTKKTLWELGTNLISFSPEEHLMIHNLNEQLKDAKSINHQNLDILSSYQDYLIASFANYVSLQ